MSNRRMVSRCWSDRVECSSFHVLRKAGKSPYLKVNRNARRVIKKKIPLSKFEDPIDFI